MKNIYFLTIIFLLALMISCTTTNVTNSDLDVNGVYHKLNRGTVIIKADKHTGVGFIVNNWGIVVTNNHNIVDTNTISVSFSDKNQPDIIPDIIYTSEENDIALLKIPKNDKKLYKPLRLSENKSFVGQSTFSVGNPYNLGRTFLTGRISKLDVYVDEGLYLIKAVQIQAPVSVGFSGSCLADTNADVIGMITTKIDKECSDIGFAITAETINQVINEYYEKLTKDFLSISYMELVHSKHVIKGLLIVDVRNGIGSKIGLKEDDIILHINNIEVTTESDYRNALLKYLKRNDNDTLEIIVKRGKKNILLQGEVGITNIQ